MKAEKPIILHGIAFILAISITYGAIRLRPTWFLNLGTPLNSISSDLKEYGTYQATYSDGLNSENWLLHEFHSGSVVVLGSSELTHQELNSIPNNFITKNYTQRCVAFGKAGNQCFNIFSQLLAMKEVLKNSKIVIILSPGWFEEYALGTSLETFLEFNSERFLNYIWNDSLIPKKYKNYIGEYVVNNFENIQLPSSTLKQIFYESKGENPINYFALYPFIKGLKEYNKLKIGWYEDIYRESKGKYPPLKKHPYKDFFSITSKQSNSINQKLVSVNYDSLEKSAFNSFKLISNNNLMAVENTYYDEWIRNKKPKKIRPVPISSNREFMDFKILLNMLSYYKCKPLIIMQPLNTHVFENIKDLTILKGVEKEINKYGYEFYNMFEYEKTKYINGTLNDIFHLGDLGWFKVNKKIVDYYNLANEKKHH